MEVLIDGNVAFLPGSGAAVFFSNPGYGAFAASGKGNGKSPRDSFPQLKKITTALEVAPWGEDNRFPQNIVSQMDYCGVGKAGLDFKARALWGSGIVAGKITAYEEDSSGAMREVFQPAQPGEHPDYEEFMRENNNLLRFFLEFNQDWAWFGNCFPELVLSKDGKKIKRLVHQESCDVRLKQMDDNGAMTTAYLSKLWGASKDQFVRFNPAKSVTTGTDAKPNIVDGKLIIERRLLDMYNALEDLQAAAKDGHRNVLLPVQYPSPNKTYYQLPAWDGARLAGWVEIAAKVPAMLKALYEKAFNIKYHIEIPDTYWERRFGPETWVNFKSEEKEQKRKELLQQMDKWLSGTENAHKAFVSYFDVDITKGTDVGRIKITVVDNKSTIDKEILASSTANSEILFSMQLNPDLIGAGTPGGAYGGSAGSGSNIREAYLVYTSLLHLERQIILEPLRLVQQFNGWDPNLVFRFRDVILTTTDKNTGTTKKVS